MKFDDTVPCKNFTKGTNSCQYIITHHTGGGSYEGNLKVLSGQTNRQVSCHFLIGQDGRVAKIGTPEQIQRHAGESQRGNLIGMNNYAIGIEIIDDPKQIGNSNRFTGKQREKVYELVKHLIKTYGIPVENVLKHADITWSGSKDRILWDGKSPSRKVDVDRQLWADKYPNFAEYRKSFYI